jgi:hypothetical protein
LDNAAKPNLRLALNVPAEKALARRSRRTKDVEKWQDIYKILFSETRDEEIPSPCMLDPLNVADINSLPDVGKDDPPESVLFDLLQFSTEPGAVRVPLELFDTAKDGCVAYDMFYVTLKALVYNFLTRSEFLELHFLATAVGYQRPIRSSGNGSTWSIPPGSPFMTGTANASMFWNEYRSVSPDHITWDKEMLPRHWEERRPTIGQEISYNY